MNKKVLAVLLVAVMLFALAACGKSGSGSGDGNSKTKGEAIYLGYHQGINEVDPTEYFEGMKDIVDPQKIYSSTEYTEDMFYGAYTLNDMERDIKDFRKNCSFEDIEYSNGTYNLSTLPVSVYFGKKYINCSATGYAFSNFAKVDDCEVAVLLYTTTDKIGKCICKYEVNGKKITFTELADKSSGDDFKYEIGKAVYEYEFSFSGPNLTLSKGSESVNLVAYAFSDNVESDKMTMHGYSIPQTPLINGLDYFSSSKSIINYAVDNKGNYFNVSAYKLEDNGRISVYLSNKNSEGEDEVYTNQFAYIAQSNGDSFFTNFSIILLDGTKKYYYTDDVTAREARILENDGTDIGNLSEEDIKKIAEKKADLYDDLQKELEASGINVTINRSLGEISMDATVLFAGDSSEVTPEGKKFLKKFMKVYTGIIYSEKYDGFIEKTVVEGHTAPLSGSTYESGLPLSTERAQKVMNFCISDEAGIDVSKLSSAIEAVGMSNSKPVYDENGEVDLDASRRVSFSFLVNVG